MIDIPEILYHFSGAFAAIFFIAIVFILKREKTDLIRSRIFINYKKFKTAFYILTTGVVLFSIGSFAGLINHHYFHWLHELTEILNNLGLFIFSLMILLILKKSKTKVNPK